MRANTKFSTLKRKALAVNATATLTSSQVSSGLITSTSAAAVTITLPTATVLIDQLQGKRGNDFSLIVDNSAGANTITLALGTGITAITAVLTGGATLTIGSGTVGYFRIYFTSTTTAKIARTI